MPGPYIAVTVVGAKYLGEAFLDVRHLVHLEVVLV